MPCLNGRFPVAMEARSIGESGGCSVDGLRESDEDNPRGYFEFEPVKNLLQDSTCLFEERGRAIKVVVSLLAALPPGLPAA